MNRWQKNWSLTVALFVSPSLWADAAFRDADWATRSEGDGVLMATRFDTRKEVTDWIHPNKVQDHVSWAQKNSAMRKRNLRRVSASYNVCQKTFVSPRDFLASLPNNDVLPIPIMP